MSICDKIQHIGNTLETNLNNLDVDCTFGIGTGEQNIYNMVKLINEQNIRGIGDTNIQIMPNRPYVTSGETIDVTVRLLDGVGNPLTNKIITISDGTNSYNGITDSDGIYTLFNQTITTTTTYTVTYGTETASKTIQVIDVMIDYAVTNNKSTKWYVRSTDASSLSVTVDDNGTNLSNSSTTSRFYFANPQSVISDTPPITIGDFVVECDVVSTTFESGTQIAFLLQGLTQNFNLSSFTPPYHLKMERIGDTVKMYVDDNNWKTTTISSRTSYYMGFQLYKNCSIKFKNYRIYDFPYLFFDKGTTASHNDSWANLNSYITVSRNDEYTTLTPSVNYSQNRYILPNVPTQPFVIEFDKHNTSMAGAYFVIGNVAIQLSSSFSGNLASANHLKFTIENNKVTCEHDGVVEQTQMNLTSLNDGIRFQINNNNEGNVITFSNFRMYNID